MSTPYLRNGDQLKPMYANLKDDLKGKLERRYGKKNIRVIDKENYLTITIFKCVKWMFHDVQLNGHYFKDLCPYIEARLEQVTEELLTKCGVNFYMNRKDEDTKFIKE